MKLTHTDRRLDIRTSNQETTSILVEGDDVAIKKQANVCLHVTIT